MKLILAIVNNDDSHSRALRRAFLLPSFRQQEDFCWWEIQPCWLERKIPK